jgi:hypothetical protein
MLAKTAAKFDLVGSERRVADLQAELSRVRGILSKPPQIGLPLELDVAADLPAWGPQTADILLPAGAKPGDLLQARAFGRELRAQVPDGVCPGQWLRLCLPGDEGDEATTLFTPRLASQTDDRQ